jgi:drug/metabolite transporter (DMT)-like permease
LSRYQNNNLLGIGLMLIAMLLFETMDAVVKLLVSDDMPAVQVVAIRSWMITPVVLIFFASRGKLSELSMRRPGQHLLRGMLGFLAPFSFFTSLKTLPLADATVVFFSAAFVLTAASAIFLKEHVGVHRWSAVAVGFIGVIIAMNPTGGGDIGAYLLVLCATLFYAMIFISGKRLSEHDSVMSLVFSLHLGMGIAATAALPWVWVPVSMPDLGNLAIVASIALVAHYVFTTAFARAEVSALAPFEYSALLWAVLIGYLIWGDLPTVEVWTGAAIIIAAGLYMAHRESLHHKASKINLPKKTL